MILLLGLRQLALILLKELLVREVCEVRRVQPMRPSDKPWANLLLLNRLHMNLGSHPDASSTEKKV
jgi:hypothetical protein